MARAAKGQRAKPAHAPTARAAQTIRNLDFLEQWRDFLLPYHLIVIQARARPARSARAPFRGAGEGPAPGAVRQKLGGASALGRAQHACAANEWCTLAESARSGACEESRGCSSRAAPLTGTRAQDGDPSKPKVTVPEGYSYEIYNRDDIERIMARGAARPGAA